MARPTTRVGIALGVAYVAALLSIASFLWRGGTGQPTQLEFGLLVVTLTLYVLFAFGAEPR